MKFEQYVGLVEEAYDRLIKKYPDKQEAFMLLNLAISARNADNMNSNITGVMTVKEPEKS